MADQLSQPSDNRGSFSSDLGPFQGLKIEVHRGRLGETQMTDDVTLWSKLESTW